MIEMAGQHLDQYLYQNEDWTAMYQDKRMSKYTVNILLINNKLNVF